METETKHKHTLDCPMPCRLGPSDLDRIITLTNQRDALLAALEREQSFRHEIVEGIMDGRLNAGRMRSVAEHTRAAIALVRGS